MKRRTRQRGSRRGLGGFVRLVLIVAGLAGPGAARADTVYFQSGNELSCKVIPPAEGDEYVRVLVGPEEQGSMLLRRESIERIEYDYDSRLAALADDDYPGHYELGLWCLERDLVDKALERLRHAHGHEGVPPESAFHIARAYEKQGPPGLLNARKYYEAYLEAAPQGDRAEAARQGLERVNERIRAQGLDPQPTPAPSEPQGLETGDWSPPGWGYDAEVQRAQVQGREGQVVLKIAYKHRDARGRLPRPDQRKTPVQLSVEEDLTGTPVLQFDVYNPEKAALPLSVAVATGPSFEWFESEVFTVPPEQWRTDLRMDLSRKTWKSAAAGWQHTTAVQNLDRVRNLILILHNEDRTGEAYVDAVRFSEE